MENADFSKSPVILAVTGATTKQVSITTGTGAMILSLKLFDVGLCSTAAKQRLGTDFDKRLVIRKLIYYF